MSNKNCLDSQTFLVANGPAFPQNDLVGDQAACEIGVQKMKSSTHSPLFVTKELFDTRYQGADAIFMAGSVVHGEATAHSDLDLVVLYPHVDRAFRESFFHKGWPVEAFIHDPETLRYFFHHVDKNIGRATLAEMITEGHEVPAATSLTAEMKVLSQATLQEGPPALTEEDLHDRRYHISEILDDMREPRNRQELAATATLLYNELADLYLRTRRGWTGTGKNLVKRMKRADPAFARKFTEAFDDVFMTGSSTLVIAMAEEMLSLHGGLLFEGYHRFVPVEWRQK
jgi:hypothetical protein